MSIVGVAIHNSGALIMGDTKLNDNKDVNFVRKIFKKGNILLGYTGNLLEIKAYPYPIFNNDMTLNEEISYENPLVFISDLDKRFNIAKANNTQYDTIFAVIGKINDGYIAKRYCLSNKGELSMQVDTLISNNEVQTWILGEENHVDYFYKILDENPPHNYEDFISAFQQMLDHESATDSSINNILQYEQM